MLRFCFFPWLIRYRCLESVGQVGRWPKASLIYNRGKVTPSLFDNPGMRLSSRRLQWRLQTSSYVFCGFHVPLRCGLRCRRRTVLGCRAPSHVDRVSLKWWRISLRLGERVRICWHDWLDVYERDPYIHRWTGPQSQSSLLMWLRCWHSCSVRKPRETAMNLETLLKVGKKNPVKVGWTIFLC